MMASLDSLIEPPPCFLIRALVALYRFARMMASPDSLIETPLHRFPIRMALVALYRFVRALASPDLPVETPLHRFLIRAMACLGSLMETPPCFLFQALVALYRFERALVPLDSLLETPLNRFLIRVALFATYRFAPKLDRLFGARCLAVWVVSLRAVVQPGAERALDRAGPRVLLFA